MTIRVCRMSWEGRLAVANEELVAFLKQGTEAWNAWRAQHREASVDFSGAALRALDLAEANLVGVDLRRADLRGTVLTKASLAGACLQGANIFKAVLDGADLRDADLCGARFLHCAQLQAALHWQTTFRDEALACGAAIPRSEVQEVPD
jgi:uncharacterized protein YjbI with pentapeptide repeats